MTKIVFVDVETTGLDPDRHAIWEVALITPDGAEHVWQFPVDEVAADPGALKISGWYERRWEVAGADQGYVCIGSSDVHLYRTEGDRRAVPPSIQGAWAECFRDLVGTAHMCGAVVSFDEERLRRLLLRHGIRPRWHYHLIDVEALAAGWLAAIRRDASDLGGAASDPITEHCVNMVTARPPWDSGELSRAVGVNPDDFDRHTALGDARWAKAIYEAVLG